MHTYIWRGKYSIDAFAGMLSSPVHRMEAAKKLIEDNGADFIDAFYSVSTNEAVVILRAEPEQLTQIEMIAMASRSFTDMSTETLVSLDQMYAAMQAGQKIQAGYKGAAMDEIDRMLLDE